MQFSVAERLVLLHLLPKEGNYVTLKIVRQIREALSFGEEEIQEVELVQSGDTVTWNETKDPQKDVTIGLKMTDLIVTTLNRLDEQGKLTDREYGLYERFCIAGAE